MYVICVLLILLANLLRYPNEYQKHFSFNTFYHLYNFFDILVVLFGSYN